jgi:hypothetical protein
MSTRIRKHTKIGKGKYVVESYSPSQYIFISIVNAISKAFVFIGFKFPYHVLKYAYNLIIIVYNKNRNTNKI